MENRKSLMSQYNSLVRLLVLFSFLIIVHHPGYVYGQSADEIDSEVNGPRKNTAPVKIDGRILFYVGGISSYTAEERAAAISGRISDAASNPSVSVDSVRVVSEKDRDMVYAGSEFIMNIFDLDASAERISRAVLAELMKKMTAQAIELHRHERSRPVLIK
ncbi:MAG: hypothetical protein HGA37_07130, partial [Lentimicrobium sp.]|nr:hypothetical protein [Lentimicrobium sp.]